MPLTTNSRQLACRTALFLAAIFLVMILAPSTLAQKATVSKTGQGITSPSNSALSKTAQIGGAFMSHGMNRPLTNEIRGGCLSGESPFWDVMDSFYECA